MKTMKINPRIKAILVRLGKEEQYVAISQIAQELAVSAKTVMRELPEVERHLSSCGMRLDKKTGVGIRIADERDARRRLLESLETSEENHSYSPQERQTVIISKLLQNQEPVKLYEFTSILKVTEGTISNDLDKLEPWFSRCELNLVRKPGLGVYVEGLEQNIRKAIVHYIYEHINETQLLNFLHDSLAEADPSPVARESSKYLMNLVDTEIIRGLESAIREVAAAMNYKLADNAYIGLIVHLALAIQRIRKGEKIEIERPFLAQLRSNYEFTVAERIAKRIAHSFAVFIPDDEIGYITMHLLGARNQYNQSGGNQKIIDNFHLVKIAKAMMKIAQQETGKPLFYNEKLLIGLVNHLAPSISRLRMNLEIRNPLLKAMQQQYPELLAISKKCAAVLEKELQKPLPDAEIAYIAMHLGAAVEDSNQQGSVERRVAIACTTGMGSSRLLATQVQKVYPNIKVVDLISVIRLDAAQLKRRQVEFIISTVPIQNANLPVVVINSLLNQEGRAKIDRQIEACDRALRQSAAAAPEPLPFKERLALLNSYSGAIIQILHNFFVLENDSSRTMEQLAQSVGKAARCGEKDRTDIAAALLARETQGGTRIADRAMVLLHCRSCAVSQLQFGVVHLAEAAFADDRGEKLRTALVMLAPAGSDESSIEAIGYISEILLERWGLIEILHKGDQEMIYLELVKIFTTFYQNKNRTLMEE